MSMGGIMRNLIMDLHRDNLRLNNILDLLSSQLDEIDTDSTIDYNLILDAVNFLDIFSELALFPKEHAIFQESFKNISEHDTHKFYTRLQSEHKLLKALIRDVHDYIEAALFGEVVLKEPLVRELSIYIKLQHEHVNYEEFLIFQLLKENISVEKLIKIHENFSFSVNRSYYNNVMNECNGLYKRVISTCEQRMH